MRNQSKQSKQRRAAGKRRAKVKRILENREEQLVQMLNDMVNGKPYTIWQRLHLTLFENSNPADQTILEKIFKREEENDLTKAVA